MAVPLFSYISPLCSVADIAETPIRFGVLGCADIARTVSKAITLSPNSTLYAVGSRSLDKAKKFAAENGFPPSAKIYGNYEAVLDDPDVEAVYMPLPTSLHAKWAVLAAEKKKHLLLEKPVALNVAELDRIIEACEANGVQFMDGTMWMHHPRTAKMKEFLSDSQRFGQLKTCCRRHSRTASPIRHSLGTANCEHSAKGIDSHNPLSQFNPLRRHSRSVDKAKKFAAENGFPPSAKFYGSYEAVLDDPDVDAEYVPLPTGLHVKWAVLAAEKRKHLLLEKPVALNVAEFDWIIEACEANGVHSSWMELCRCGCTTPELPR